MNYQTKIIECIKAGENFDDVLIEFAVNTNPTSKYDTIVRLNAENLLTKQLIKKNGVEYTALAPAWTEIYKHNYDNPKDKEGNNKPNELLMAI